MLFVQFTSPKAWFTPFAWLVRLFERSPYSHVRFYLQISPQYHVIFEASGTSVKFIGQFASAQHATHIHAEYEVAVQNSDILLHFLPYAGIKYGALQIVGIALARIFNLSKNPFGDGNRTLICSELVTIIIRDILNMEVPANIDLIGPKQLEQYMLQHPEVFKKIS